MSNPENASSETRAHAILDFCERIVRDQLPDLDDGESDGPFMCGCVSKFGKDMKYLTRRASAQTTNAFYRALTSADSMRVVPIDPESKDGKRLKCFHCDVCGTKEHNCRYAIDLAGFLHKPDVWFGEPKKIKGEWNGFIQEYEDRFHDNEVEGEKEADGTTPAYILPEGMVGCDQGRYYVGSTCLRKSKLVFLCSTLLQETMYKMYHQLDGVSDEDYKKPELLCVTDDLVQEFIDTKQELELCIANEARKSVPDVEQDDSFWEMIDLGREVAAAKTGKDIHDVIRQRTANTLAAMADDSPREATDEGDEGGSVMGSDDESFVYDEKDEDEDEDEDDDPPKKRPSVRSRRIDIDTDSEDNMPPPEVAPKPKRQKASAEPTRRSKRVAGTAALVIADTGGNPGTSNSNSALGATFNSGGRSNAAGKRPMAPRPAPDPAPAAESVADAAAARRAAHPVGSMPQPPPRASRIAAGLRIPGADGSPGPLGSRRAALLDLMDVQRALTQDKMDDRAAKLTRAIMCYQELVDLQGQ